MPTSAVNGGAFATADTFIAVPQGALLACLSESWGQAGLDPADLGEVARLLGLMFRIEGRGALMALREDYHGFNPDLPPNAALAWGADRAADYERLKARLTDLLQQANFSPVDPDRLSRAERNVAEVDASVRIPWLHYADVAFFARGRRMARATRTRFLGLVKRDTPALRLRHVVVFIRFHDSILDRARRLPLILGPRPPSARFEGRVVIKLFTDVAEADLNMLYPGARAVMRLRDKLLLGVPAVAGGVPILMNILPALSVLFVVAAAYLGFSAGDAVARTELAKALAAMSALAGLGGFLMRQWVKYERQVLKYQMALTDTLYYRNLCNNSAVFDYLLGTAEDQEFKEALLAYALLSQAGPDEPMPRPGLKAAVEAWLWGTFSTRVDFDINDAVAKLERLNLLAPVSAEASDLGGDMPLRARTPTAAITTLRALWHRQAGDTALPSAEPL